MTFRDTAEETVNSICEILEIEAPPGGLAKAVDIVEKTLIQTALEARNTCAEVAMNRSVADKDVARQISEDIRRADRVLIANLSSLR